MCLFLQKNEFNGLSSSSSDSSSSDCQYYNASEDNLQYYLHCLQEPFQLNFCYFGFSTYKHYSTVLRFILCLSS